MLPNPSCRSLSPSSRTSLAKPIVTAFTAALVALAVVTLTMTSGARQAAAQVACSGLEVEAAAADVAGTSELVDVAGRSAIGVPADAPNEYTFNKENAASFCVDIDKAGIYQLRAETYATSQQADSFWVAANDDEAALWDVPKAAEWVSSIVTERSGKEPVELRLEAGTNEITFYARESGTFLSQFTLLRSANLGQLERPACAGLEQEAEGGSVGGQMLKGARLITNSVNEASSGGFVAAPPWLDNETELVRSHVAEYCVRSASAGSFQLAVRALAPGSGSDSFWVQVNGNSPVLWDIDHSSDWTDHIVRDERADEDLVFGLREGANTLRFYQRDSGTLLDKFVFVPEGDDIDEIRVAPAPIATAVPTATAIPTATAAPTATAIPTATPAPTATAIPTATPAPTATAIPTATPAPTATAIPTATPVPTATAIPTATPVPTATPAPTPTALPTATPAPTEPPVSPAYVGSVDCIRAIAGRPMSVPFADAFVQRSADQLTYSLLGADLPPGAAIDDKSGLFTSARLPVGANDFTFQVRASNAAGSAVGSICIESAAPTPAPVFTGVPVTCYVARAAQAFSLDIGEMFDDAQDDRLSFFLDDSSGNDPSLRNFSIDANSGQVRVNRLTNSPTRIAMPIEVSDGRNVAEVTLCLAVAGEAPVDVGPLGCISLSTRGAPVEFEAGERFLDLAGDRIDLELVAGPGQSDLSGDDVVTIAPDPTDYFVEVDIVLRASDGENTAIWTLCANIALIGDAIPSDDLELPPFD